MTLEEWNNFALNLLLVFFWSLILMSLLGWSRWSSKVQHLISFVIAGLIYLAVEMIFHPVGWLKALVFFVVLFVFWWRKHKRGCSIALLVFIITVFCGLSALGSTQEGRESLTGFVQGASTIGVIYDTHFDTPTPRPTEDFGCLIQVTRGIMLQADADGGTFVGRVVEGDIVAYRTRKDDQIKVQHVKRGWTGYLPKSHLNQEDLEKCIPPANKEEAPDTD